MFLLLKFREIQVLCHNLKNPNWNFWFGHNKQVFLPFLLIWLVLGAVAGADGVVTLPRFLFVPNVIDRPCLFNV